MKAETGLTKHSGHSIEAMEKMGEYVAKSGLFGMKTPAQAVALMIVAQAEGRHPGSVASDYHIIQGRPSLKADTMLARFQQAGGSVKWIDYTDSRVSGTFSHPQGGSVTVDWDMARAKNAGLGGKDNWKNYPRAMLRARVVSEGIRTVYPAVLGGMYTPEEVGDFSGGNGSGAQREEPIEPEYVQDDDAAFDSLLTSVDADLSLMPEFVATIAKQRESTEGLVKSEAVNRWDEFIGAYHTWAEKKNGNGKQDAPASLRKTTKQASKGKKGTDVPPEEKALQNADIPCPDRDGVMVNTLTDCVKCDSREGCPEIENLNGQTEAA